MATEGSMLILSELCLAKEKMCACGVKEGFSLVGVEPLPGPNLN